MKRWLADIARVFIMVVCTGYVLYLIDPVNVVLFQTLGVSLFLAGCTHITRRLLFHRLDLQSIAKRAIMEQNVAAAIVVLSICIVLATLLWISAKVLG